ncbi:MAG: dynamin family protein [Desulfovibrionaceae bacterium]|nr:dynamin family protein [Desulfovibrionaceae bacterium]
MEFTDSYTALKTLLIQADHSQALEELERIKTQHDDPCFRTALVGGFSQGKTYIVNHLLETDVFPTAVTPETALLYEMSFGTEPSASLWRNDAEEKLPLTQEALAQLSASKNQYSLGDCVRAHLPHPLLRSGMILYDTPGIDDILESRAAISLHLLSQCDGAIVVISAIAPLTLLERTFIETYLIDRAIPNLAILINFYDKLPDKDKAKQLEFIKNKVSQAYPNAELWLLTDDPLPCDAHIRATNLAAMRERLHAWIQASLENPNRHARDMRRLIQLLTTELASFAKEEAMLQGDIAKARAHMAKAREELQADGARWRSLVRDFQDHGNEAAMALTLEVERLSEELEQSLSYDDIKAIRDALPKRLAQLRDRIDASIQDRLKDDILRLTEAMQAEFGYAASVSDATLPAKRFNIEIPVFATETSLMSPILQIFQTQATTIVTSILAYFVKDQKTRAMIAKPILQVIQSLCSNLASEPSKNEINAALRKFTGSFNLAITQYMRTLYEEYTTMAKSYQEKWLAKEEERLQSIENASDRTQRLQTLQTLTHQGQELLAQLSAHKDQA